MSYNSERKGKPPVSHAQFPGRNAKFDSYESCAGSLSNMRLQGSSLQTFGWRNSPSVL